MKTAGFGRPLAHSLLAALMVSISPMPGVAQSHDDHGGHAASQWHKPTPQESALVEAVRSATEKYKNVRSVEGPGDGYELKFGCVSGGDFGAMGMHFVNFKLVDGEVDVTQPEIVLFEPTPNGGIRITGADFLDTRRRVGCRTRSSASGACGSAGADGSAVPSVRQSESVRARPVLHAARLGVEGQSQRYVRELEP